MKVIIELGDNDFKKLKKSLNGIDPAVVKMTLDMITQQIPEFKVKPVKKADLK